MGLSLISTQIATTYVFQAAPGEFGWANCTVNNVTGELSIQSDWGSWAYGWSPDPRHLGAPSLTAFIGSRADVDYLARKLQREGNGRRWSVKATAGTLCRLVLERRLKHGREQLEGRLEPEDYDCGRIPNRFLDRYTEAGLPIYSCLEIDAPTWCGSARKEYLRYLDRDGARRLWNEIGEIADEVGCSSDQFFDQALQIEGFTDYVTAEPWQYSVTVQTSEDRVLREIVLPALIQACRVRAVAEIVPIVTAEGGL